MNSKSSNNGLNSSKKGESITAFPCKLWPKNVNDNDHAVSCNPCQTWVYIKYNHLSNIDCKYLQGCDEPWYCLSCTNTLFLFGNLKIENFLTSIGDNNTISNKKKFMQFSASETTPDVALLCDQFNNTFPENRSDPKNLNIMT